MTRGGGKQEDDGAAVARFAFDTRLVCLRHSFGSRCHSFGGESSVSRSSLHDTCVLLTGMAKLYLVMPQCS